MKVKVETLWEAQKAIEALLGDSKKVGEEQKEDTRDFKLTYRLGRISKKIIKEIGLIGETRNKMIRKYSDRLDNGQMKIRIKDADLFEKEWGDFIKQEIELDITPIPFKLIKGTVISPLDLGMLLDWLIEDPEEESAQNKEVKAQNK